MTHIPYRGDPPALTDLMTGQVQIAFTTMIATVPLVTSGKVRALAVTSAVRSEALPGVPAISEYIPGFDVNGWLGMSAPRGTPEGILDVLNREIIAALATQAFKTRHAELNATALTG